jgi:hypothetical protein
MEDNGFSSSHPNYTLLCTARVKPSEWAFSEMPELDQIGKDGLTACSMQWCPSDDSDG